MYQSGRAGDEAKKRQSPAKSGRVGITVLHLFRSQKQMCCKRQPLQFLLETGPERIQILRHLDGAYDWLSVSSFVYEPIRMHKITFFLHRVT